MDNHGIGTLEYGKEVGCLCDNQRLLSRAFRQPRCNVSAQACALSSLQSVRRVTRCVRRRKDQYLQSQVYLNNAILSGLYKFVDGCGGVLAL